MNTNAIAAFVALALAGCGSGGSDGAAPFPDVAYAHVDSANGAYSIDVRTSPQPPRVGLSSVELRIHDRGGAPASGLALQVTPVMPAHAHGASVHPTVRALGGGVYVLDNVSTFMAGTWELKTSIGGTPDDEAAILLDVR